MPKFFRGPDSDSSSNSSASSSDSEDEPLSADSIAEGARDGFAPLDLVEQQSPEHQGNTSTQVSARLTESPRDFLLHALLEERCLNQARTSRLAHRYGHDSPEVLAEAKANYLRLCSQLSPLNLISTGLEHDRHSTTRQRFRDGLEILNGRESVQSAVPPPLRRLLTDTESAVYPTTQQHGQHPMFGDNSFPGPLQRLLTSAGIHDLAPGRPHSLYSSPALAPILGQPHENVVNRIFESRYYRDFEELSLLGRGGFGVVYHVRHRLDKQAYAIKKIPLSRNRIHKIQRRGQPELDEFLTELQTLARLEHPNIVRYYGGWIEWVDGPSIPRFVSSESDLQANEHAREDGPSFENPWSASLSRVMTQPTSEPLDVVFEESRSSNGVLPAVDHELSEQDDLRLQRLATKSTIATVSDDTAESIERSEELSASIASAMESSQFSEPTLALHVQMSLHPMTLSDFLSPPTGPNLDHAQPLLHCFHLAPSVDILLAILDGVEYLHSEGIVHRDIKPANIFLGASTNSRARGSVDLARCSECHNNGQPNPVFLHVRIGDFGLVTALAQDSTEPVESAAIGTEIYRPPTAMDNASPGLDLYALGIIAFELLHKFETRMERHQLIRDLKQGHYPAAFTARFGKVQAARMKACIDVMLSRDGEVTSIKQVKEKLMAMPS